MASGEWLVDKIGVSSLLLLLLLDDAFSLLLDDTFSLLLLDDASSLLLLDDVFSLLPTNVVTLRPGRLAENALPLTLISACFARFSVPEVRHASIVPTASLTEKFTLWADEFILTATITTVPSSP